MKISLPFFMMILFASCGRETITTSVTIFKNSTVHIINVTPYRSGRIDSTIAFHLLPGDSMNFYDYNTVLIGGAVSYGDDYHGITDSLVVTFDNIYKIAHYQGSLIGSRPKRYLFSSYRNIYNDSSYRSMITYDYNRRRAWEIRYTFTVQDYLDAL